MKCDLDILSVLVLVLFSTLFLFCLFCFSFACLRDLQLLA